MTLEKEKDMYIHMLAAFTVLLTFLSGRLIVTSACHAISPGVVATYYPLLQFVAAKGSTPVYQLVEISPTSWT
jgi:hypothetical protein